MATIASIQSDELKRSALAVAGVDAGEAGQIGTALGFLRIQREAKANTPQLHDPSETSKEAEQYVFRDAGLAY
ncbi:MAG: hypothetical protein LZF60_80494 [Nitrospira sp.]|nr:MAG: hypothetical protein LZF60_80494 [Nitrospira sp.]